MKYIQILFIKDNFYTLILYKEFEDKRYYDKYLYSGSCFKRVLKLLYTTSKLEIVCL